MLIILPLNQSCCFLKEAPALPAFSSVAESQAFLRKIRAARGFFCALIVRSSRDHLPICIMISQDTISCSSAVLYAWEMFFCFHFFQSKISFKKNGTPLKRSSSDQNAFVPEIRLFTFISLFKIAGVLEILIVRHKFPPGDPFFHAFLFN